MGNSVSDIQIKLTKTRLDVLDPHKRVGSIVSKHPLLVEPTNEKSEAESPVFRLPTELTMQIFQECGSDIRLRLILTHICHRWRQIAVNDPSLWTSIHIDTILRNSKSRLDHFLAFLGMQLDRTGNLLLDIKWASDISDRFCVRTVQFIRKKAPFSRWRSFDMHIMNRSNVDDPWSGAPWSTADAFTNLEFLIVWEKPDNTIISPINRTITSRLKELKAIWHFPSAGKIATYFAKPLTHITSLHLNELHYDNYGPFLPANVVNLEVVTALQHPFLHIHTYTLDVCIFTEVNTVDLRNLTTLIVRRDLVVRVDCHVLLPALRELKLGNLTIELGTKIEAPALDILYFMTPAGFGVNAHNGRLPETNWSLQQSSYLLSPNTSVIADSYLPSSIIIRLLAKSPKVTHVTLRLEDWTDAQAVLERLVGFKAKSDSNSAETVHLCPRLSELRLDFHGGSPNRQCRRNG